MLQKAPQECEQRNGLSQSVSCGEAGKMKKSKDPWYPMHNLKVPTPPPSVARRKVQQLFAYEFSLGDPEGDDPVMRPSSNDNIPMAPPPVSRQKIQKAFSFMNIAENISPERHGSASMSMGRSRRKKKAPVPDMNVNNPEGRWLRGDPWTSLTYSPRGQAQPCHPPVHGPASSPGLNKLRVLDLRKNPKFTSTGEFSPPPVQPPSPDQLEQEQQPTGRRPQRSQVIDKRKKKKHQTIVTFHRSETCEIQIGDRPLQAPSRWRRLKNVLFRHPKAAIAAALLLMFVICALVTLVILLITNGPQEPDATAKPPNRFGPGLKSTYAYLSQYVDEEKDACDNFYSFACGRFHKNQTHQPPLSFVKTAAQNKRAAIMRLARSGTGQTLSKSFQNLRQFFEACLSAHKLTTEHAHEYRSNIQRVTASTPSKLPAWQSVVEAALRNGFDHNFFVNVSVVLVDNQPPTLKVSPPMDLQLYNYLWEEKNNEKLLRLIGLGSGYNNFDYVQEAEPVRSFGQALQAATLTYFRSEPPKESNSTFGADDWLKFLQGLTGDKSLTLETVPDYLPLKPYLISMLDLINGTRHKDWLAYVGIMLVLRDCTYLPPWWKTLCPRADPNVINEPYDLWEDHCLDLTMESPWFRGVADAQYIQTVTADAKLSAKMNRTVKEVFTSVVDVASSWLGHDPWLNAISKSGAQHHLDALQLSLGWCQPGFGMPGFEAMYPTAATNLSSNYFLLMLHELRQRLFVEHVDLITRGVEYQRRYQSCRPTGDWAPVAKYENTTHTIVMEPFSLKLLLNLPKVNTFATVGTWMGTAILASFKFPEFRKNDCIYPGTMWKYNLQLYRENHGSCVEQQYREYARSFALTHTAHDLPAIVGNLSVITGSNFAYLAYRKWIEKVGPQRRTPEFRYTGQQLYWILWMTRRCGDENFWRFGSTTDHTRAVQTLVPDFVVMGPSYTSKDFSDDFGCDHTDKMVPSVRCDFVE